MGLAGSPLPRLRGRWSYVPALIVITLGMALSIKAYTLARQADLDELQARFVPRASERIYALERDLSTNLEAVKFIGDLYNASLFVERREFASFVHRMLEEHPSLEFLGWIPRTADEGRLALISLARSQGYQDFSFHQSGPAGEPVPVTAREAYFPVYYLEPESGYGELLGRDLAAPSAHRSVIEQARDSGQLAATGGVSLGRSGALGLLAFWPIYAKWQTVETVEQRRRQLQGLALAGIWLTEVVRRSQGPELASGLPLKLHIYDRSEAEPQLLYGEPLAPLPAVPQDGQPQVADFHLARRLDVAGRDWLVVCDVDRQALDAFGSVTPIWVLLLGVFLTLTLAAYLVSNIRRAALVEQQVFERTEKLNFRTRELAASNNKLVKEVSARRDAERRLALQVEERDLANAELQRTLARLRQTQDQLIQTEKLASLGSLVAGVAHEINTPVGVAVTAASTLQVRGAELRRAIDAGQLKKSLLNGYLETADQSARMILGNLERAAELIHSFKQVAVDRSSSERRLFALHEYIDEILLSLRPRLKKTRLRVDVECDEELTIDSYPGTLSQVLTNLIMNSLTHGYDEDQAGVLRIAAWLDKGQLVLRYSDDGKGMSPEQVRRVFEPFYTTRRGQGGSGLGMHIVYNLVTQTLGGHIHVESKPGEGVVFTTIIPAHQDTAGQRKREKT